MSRGLGVLQRYIKAVIEGVDAAYRKECEECGEDDPEGQYWLTWPQIKYLLKRDMGLNPEDKLDPSIERSLKRALYLLAQGNRKAYPRIHLASGRSSCAGMVHETLGMGGMLLP